MPSPSRHRVIATRYWQFIAPLSPHSTIDIRYSLFNGSWSGYPITKIEIPQTRQRPQDMFSYTKMNEVITIDGPAGSGKSTVSRLLAKRINGLYLDTGAMYRAVALAAKRKGIDFDDGKRLREMCKSINLHFMMEKDPPVLYLEEEDISAAIRNPEMDMLSSKVSAVSEVREAMVALQRKMAEGIRVVAEGRDMGSVVFPLARHKFFLTASHDVRAERRYRERLAQGSSESRALVGSKLKERDHQDETRTLSPLRPAKNAIIIDSSLLTVNEVVEIIFNHLSESPLI